MSWKRCVCLSVCLSICVDIHLCTRIPTNVMEYDEIPLCRKQHTNTASRLYCRQHIMSLVYDFNIAMKAYGEEKVNPYFNIIHSRYINLSICSINKNTCTQIYCSALLTYFNHRHVSATHVAICREVIIENTIITSKLDTKHSLKTDYNLVTY